MEMTKIWLDGKALSLPLYSKVSDLFPGEGKKKYEDDPIVGVLLNGILSPLSERINGESIVEEVHLFSTLGRRVYRRSLILLLFYASSLVYPARPLRIAHSLGDGYYFHYEDDEDVDIDLLKQKMEEAIKNKVRIESVFLTHEEAIRSLEKCNLNDTVKLLQTLNNESYRFSRIENYLQLYTEPVLEDASLLTLWEIRKYSKGILLRYPQSRSIRSIRKFSDNPLLFSIFEDTRKNESRLGLKSLGDLNMMQSNGGIEENILMMETLQRMKILEATEKAVEKKDLKVIFIAGPSSSGKTTFSLKLSENLRVLGKKPIKISLDDYYKPRSEVPRDENGDYDFEALEALELALLEEQMEMLIKGKGVHLPSFSFKNQKRTFGESEVRMDEDSVLVIEGIHGLNPNLIPSIDEKYVFRIYISALTSLNLDSSTRISTTDNRIIRRMVRDKRTRGIGALETIERWPSVERGEKNHIFPYQNNANIMINSALDYELGVLAPMAMPLLRSVGKQEEEAYVVARRLIEFLSFFYPISDHYVPSDSLLREFIGGSIYEAI